MKPQIVLILLTASLSALAGCQAPTSPDHYQLLVKSINQSIDATGEAAEQVIDAMKKYETIPADKLAQIEVAITSTAETINVLQDAALKAAIVYDEKASEDKLGALIDAAIVANTASSPVNPYAGPIGGVLAVIATGYAAIKRKELAIMKPKYKAHKQGVDTYMREATDSNAGHLYVNIGKARKANGVA